MRARSIVLRGPAGACTSLGGRTCPARLPGARLLSHRNAAASLQWKLTRARSRPPSFASKYAEQRRVRAVAEDLGVTDPVWHINAKGAASAWVEAFGARRPQVLGVYADVRDVPWDRLPDRVVVKPDRGAGGQGVRLLERQGSAWRDVLLDRQVTSEVLVDRLRSFADRGIVSRSTVVEEMVDDPQRPRQVPVDWKFYTFFGTVGLVLARAPVVDARRRLRPGWRMFDAQWRDLGQVYSGHLRDDSIAPPLHADELLSLAQRLSASVPRPFLRVDLYDDHDGAVFGELTPQPGGEQRFRRDVDRRLGEHWEMAEARIFARAVTAGVYTPATAPVPESGLQLPGATASS